MPQVYSILQNRTPSEKVGLEEEYMDQGPLRLPKPRARQLLLLLNSGSEERTNDCREQAAPTVQKCFEDRAVTLCDEAGTVGAALIIRGGSDSAAGTRGKVPQNVAS
jgi:hypothetical protein